jgi:transposase InsO family protein
MMENRYYDVSHADSFGSFAGLRRQTKATDSDIHDFLAKQRAYTLHRNIRRKFMRRKTWSKCINDLWQIDLVDLSSLSRYNNGYRYLLTCIDVFSKVARVVPVKSKNASVVRDAFATMLLDDKPNLVQSDKGTEFLNSIFQQLLTANDIRHYTSENDDIKCAVVERFNRTILTKLFKYFTYKNTYHFLDILPSLIKSYNATFHRSIKMAPKDVKFENESLVRKRLYPPKPKRLKWKYELGDTVRLSGAKRVFAKGYRQKWTEELFKVVQRHPTSPPTYSIEDYNGERIKGKFYVQELQKVVDSGLYRIEKVLRTRKRAGQDEYFVKWEGYPASFNSWVQNVEHL